MNPRLLKYVPLLFLCIATSLHSQAASPPVIQLQPGDDVLGFVNASSEGTTFVFAPGTYRLLQIVPKSRDTFTGGSGVIFSGARLLTQFDYINGLWSAGGQSQHAPVHGECAAGYPRCYNAEDLYLDDVPLRAVASMNQVAPGKWYFDYDAQRIYMGDDPTGRKVEASVSTAAFSGAASDVTITGITIEKYAAPAQFGAINPTGSSWIIKNNEIRLNHGSGLRISDGMQVLNNSIHDNGQMGIGGTGNNVLVDSNNISKNNWAGFDPTWEAGGAKFVRTQNLTVRGNTVSNNVGTGLWTDSDNVITIYDSNTVFNNAGPGIQHEISFNALISNNSVKNNGTGGNVWVWGAQILIQNSENVEVTKNDVEVAATYGNGITVVQQNRGSYVSGNNYIHHNDITYNGPIGVTGAAADYNADSFFRAGNNFDYNTYHCQGLMLTHWVWNDPKLWKTFQNLGQEPHGTVDSVIPAKTATRTRHR